MKSVNNVKSEKVNEPPKEFKQKYMELQMLQHQLQQVQQQIRALDSQSMEMDSVLVALDELSKSEPCESFVTLTPGLFVRAKITDTQNVLLNVGAGVVVEKSVDDAKVVISEQCDELKKLQEELTEQLQKMVASSKKLQEELRDMLK